MSNSLKETSRFLGNLGLTGPAVVLDQDRVQQNIKVMTARSAAAGARFRPHFKTHQSGAVGQWFKREGVSCITVSSLPMAEYFAEFGWKDITLAFLLNPRELPRLGELARHLDDHGGRLGLTIDSPAAARVLAEADLPVDVWFKIDVGYGRTGMEWNNASGISAIQKALGDQLRIAGFLTHSGHSYQARTRENLQAIWNTTVDRMCSARAALGGGKELLITVGDTPCCSAVESLAGVDEIRPGNFVFFDLMQLEIGSCSQYELAAAVACPVVGIYPERSCIVVHGGAVHLSKDSLDGPDGQAVYGKLGDLSIQPDGTATLGQVVPEATMVALSQEHGTIALDPDRFTALCGQLEVGDLVLAWPVHSCLACENFDQYHTLDGTVLPRR